MPTNSAAFIDQLIALRKSKNLSQQKLADLCGLLQPAIARLESKQAIPSLDTICKILDAMDAELVILEKGADLK